MDPPPLAHKEPQNQEANRDAQRPLVSLQRLAGGKYPRLRSVHRFDSLLEDFFRGIGSDQREKATGSFRNFGKPVLVEARLHGFSGDITDKVLLPVVGSEGYERAFPRTDSDGKDPYSLLRRPLGGSHSVGIQFLSIGKDDEGSRLSFGFPERLLRHSDCGGDVGPAFWYDICIQLIQGIDNRGVVEREGSLEKCGASKRDETHTVALEKADQVLREQFGTGQPVRRNIRGQHAP